MNLLPEDLNGITLKQCNNIKVILALLVMLYHCCAFLGGTGLQNIRLFILHKGFHLHLC